MAIAKEFVVNLKGKEYPIFAGVLNEAHKAGLQSLTTELLQVPSADNGMTAIVQATATFADGRTFSDVGDCSPATTSPMLAAASIRLASTRAKGRVLRDAVNVGQTLLEELPDMEDGPPARSGRQVQPEAQQQNGRNGTSNGSQTRETSQEPAPIAPQTPPFCEGVTCTGAGCSKPLTRGQYEVSLKAYGAPLCPNHQKAAAGRN